MLKIERGTPSAFCEAEYERREFGTLDDIPDFALSSVSSLYNYLVRPFQKSFGVVITGPSITPSKAARSGSGEDDEGWGRSVLHLTTGEVMQLKFSPLTILSDYYDGLAMISVRLTTIPIGTQVRTCILFPPTLNALHPATMLRRMCDTVGPRGLHVLLVSFFRLHHVNPETVRGSSIATNPDGCESVRSTTLSISNQKPARKGKKGTETVPFNHADARHVAPGESVMKIASESINNPLPHVDRPPCEQTTEAKYTESIDACVDSLCSADMQLGRSGTAASIAICELLSGEGIVSMLSNDFLKACLPFNIGSPLGMGMVLAMSLRIAMRPEAYDMSVHKYGRDETVKSLHDDVSVKEFTSLFQTTIPPLENPKQVMWAIDIVIAEARQGAQKMMESNQQPNAERCVHDQMHYWHRVGKAMILGAFGIGSSCDSTEGTLFEEYAHRFHDPLVSARDKAADQMANGFRSYRDDPFINLASVHQKRTTMLKLMLDCEEFLRTGMYQGKRAMPDNDDKNSKREIKAMRNNKGYTKSHSLLVEEFNMAALMHAKVELMEALRQGPASHFRHEICAYLVSESQEVTCCICNTPVHVLQGIVPNTHFGKCAACNARKCLACASKDTFDKLAPRPDDKPASVPTCLKCNRKQASVTLSGPRLPPLSLHPASS